MRPEESVSKTIYRFFFKFETLFRMFLRMYKSFTTEELKFKFSSKIKAFQNVCVDKTVRTIFFNAMQKLTLRCLFRCNTTEKLTEVQLLLVIGSGSLITERI